MPVRLETYSQHHGTPEPISLPSVTPDLPGVVQREITRSFWYIVEISGKISYGRSSLLSLLMVPDLA